MKETPKTPSPDDYFSQRLGNRTPNIEDDQKASAEQDDLFSGDMSDIEVWLRYKKFKLQKENEDSERILREKNAEKAYKFSRNWAVFISLLILLYGFIPRSYFKLAQSEFMFVIGSLTFSILTYYLYVIKYLFYRKDTCSINSGEQ